MEVLTKTLCSKRNTEIPVTIIEGNNNKSPLVMMVHGFKADRTEDGRFLTVGRALAEDGVSSVMMGFPGCDESKEDFLYYTPENCLSDIETCYAYMKENYDIDETRIGMIGYSMGGRLTSVFVQRHPEVRVIGLWAAACFDAFDNQDTFLGMPVEEMKQEAKEKGYCDFLNVFDNTWLKLNREFLEQMETLSPEEGLRSFKGAAIVVHGDADITVKYEIAERSIGNLVKAEKKELVTVHEADHGFGAWDNRPDLSAQLTDNTIRFFRENL